MTTNKQTTLKKEVECNGIGLHSGKPVEMKLRPAPVDTGMVFVRTDLPGKPKVRAITENITGTLTLNDNLETIKDRAFYYCSGISGTVVMPESVKNGIKS